MADIDELLTEAGERWRASQPPPAPVIAPQPVPRLVPRPGLGGLIVAVAVIAALALAGIVAVGGRPQATVHTPASHVAIGWNRRLLEAGVVHAGDRVRARGSIIAAPGEPPQVCDAGIDLLMGDPPACLPIAAPVEGVDLDRLPGRTVTKGTISSGYVDVRGTWTGSALVVDSIAVAQPGAYNSERMPCPAPDGGWPSAQDNGGFRAGLDRLRTEITAHPDLYGAYWTVPITFPAVEIVETRVDPETVRSRVESIFPFSACLLAGHYSSTELEATQTALHRADLTWIAGVEDAFDRVRVELTMLDEAAVAVFVAHPEAYPAPLVVKETTPDVTPAPSNAPTVAPTSSLELVDGLPVEIDGRVVLRGDAAVAAFQATTDTTSILVGGWLHAQQVMSCPLMRTPSPWNPCAATRLYPSPFDGPLGLAIYGGAAGVEWPTVAENQVQPIVLRVHTHDPGCGSGAQCASLPVAESIAWTGAVEPVPSPTSTRPPGGISEAAAIEAAIRLAAESSSGPTVVSAVSGHYADVGPGGGDVAGDRWVWAVTLTGMFSPAPNCPAGAACPVAGPSSELIVLDAADGTFLISTSPAPSPGPTVDAAGLGALNLVSKFEIDRASANWADAWGMLGPLIQERLGSLDRFIALERAYNEAGGGFAINNVVFGPFDADTTSAIGTGILADLARAGGDPSRAELVYATHPSEPGASASSAAYLVAGVDAGWRIWIVH